MRTLAVMLLLAGCGDGGGGFEAPAGSQAEPLTANSYALADATVRDGSYARYPQGALSTLEVKTQQVGWNRASYLRFDIAGMPETGGSATLYLYGRFVGNGPPVRARVCAVGDTTWTEGTLTWNNAPAMDRRAIATTLVSGEPRWYTWDLTDHVRALKLAGATQVDLGLDNDQYNDALASFNSREAPVDPPFLALSTENANAAPTVAVPASASPAVVDRGSTVLRAVGADDQGELNLTYTWQTIGTPPAPVTYNDANGTNHAGYYALAYFTAPGDYDFRVTIADSQGLSVTSDVSVTVQLSTRYWRTVVEPQAVTLHPGETVQLHATVFDQFGATAAPQPVVYWQGHFASSGGSVTESGLYTAGAQPGDYRVYARSVGLFGGSSTITIVP